MTWLLIVAATAIGAGTAVALRWPVVGLLVYLWLDFMRPTDVFVELRFLHPMLVIGSATVAATLWQERTRLREGWRPLLPIAAVVAIVAVSVLISVDRSVSLRALIEVGKLLVLVWLMERLLRSEARIRAVLAVLVFSLGVLAIQAIADAQSLGEFVTMPTTVFIQGPTGLNDGAFRDNNDLGRVFVLGAPLGWALAAAPGSRWWRGAAAVALIVIIGGIEATFSRTGFLALLLAAEIVAQAYQPLRRALALWLAFVAVLLVVSPRTYLARLTSLPAASTDASVEGRLTIWRSASPAVRHRPLLGQGVGTFRLDTDGKTKVRRPSHNIVVELAVELGAAGLAAYAWMILEALWRLWQLRIASCSPFASTAAVGLAAALLAYLAAGLSLSHPFGSPVFVLLGLSLALARGQPPSGAAETAAP